MCYFFVDIGDFVLFVGGCGLLLSFFKDCWLYEKKLNVWRWIYDFFVLFYWLVVIIFGILGMVLFMNGRGKSLIFDGCLLYWYEKGWVECDVRGDFFVVRYGGVIGVKGSNVGVSFSGIYVGGLVDVFFIKEVMFWELDILDIRKFFIIFICL